MTSAESTRARRWLPARLFLPRDTRRSVLVGMAEIYALFGLPLTIMIGLMVRSRMRHAKRLKEAVQAATSTSNHSSSSQEAAKHAAKGLVLPAILLPVGGASNGVSTDSGCDGRMSSSSSASSTCCSPPPDIMHESSARPQDLDLDQVQEQDGEVVELGSGLGGCGHSVGGRGSQALLDESRAYVAQERMR